MIEFVFNTIFSKIFFHIFFECPIFFLQKDGTTPLYVAAENGHEQIVQILFEKGKPNVDLPDQVLLLVVFFSFFFLFSVSHFSIFLM